MATTLQESSRQRKLIYLGIIVALFTIGTFGWRGVDSALTGKPARWTVTGRANELELRELDQGNPELAGATVRLILTGSRGLAVCGLWLATIEKQRRHEWSQVELLVRSVTKLQPYFLTPWLFQSWNLAYNVSVESDRTKDKFFYIARGIELLAEGDRINRNNPDMRFWIGFYYLNKFGVADEANTLRSLFQLSCIDPLERDPRRFRPGGPGSAINLDQFEQFCKEHPQLVRRLREFLRCNRPDDVIDFLADNYKVPSRYEEGENSLTATGQTKRLPPERQFPTLPPYFSDEEPTGDSELRDDFDNYQAGRAWMAYGQKPLPPPTRLPGPTPRDNEYDRTKYRIPRAPMLVIFRQYPARSQTYVGERLAKEGWYEEDGWAIDDRKTGANRWFPDEVVRVGVGRAWAAEAWGKAHQMWKQHGENNGLLLDVSELVQYEKQAAEFRKRMGLGEYDIPPDTLPEDASPELKELHKAAIIIRFYKLNRDTSNFPRFYYGSLAEMQPDIIKARRAIYDAKQLSDAAEPEAAINRYLDGFNLWVKALSRRDSSGAFIYKDFRSDPILQEDLYEKQLAYINLVSEHRSLTLVPAQLLSDSLLEGAIAQAGGSVGPLPLSAIRQLVPNTRLLPLGLVGPFDGLHPDGTPWVQPEARDRARQRQAGLRPQQPAAVPN
jgi:hypothetical protein